MAVEIVKVQVPLNTASRDHVLVYDRERKHMVEMPLLSHVAEQLGSDAKGYFRAAWSSVVGWGISTRVADQNW